MNISTVSVPIIPQTVGVCPDPYITVLLHQDFSINYHCPPHYIYVFCHASVTFDHVENLSKGRTLYFAVISSLTMLGLFDPFLHHQDVQAGTGIFS